MTDQSKNPLAERPMVLSKDVGRIAGSLISAAGSKPCSEDPTPLDRTETVLIQRVIATIRARRLRLQYYPPGLFADPAWDMMVELLAAELTNRQIVVSDLCGASGVPATTALRWLNTLVQKGIFVRRNDPLDARRVFVELSPAGSSTMKQYFLEIA